jgi:hypothetical protein
MGLGAWSMGLKAFRIPNAEVGFKGRVHGSVFRGFTPLVDSGFCMF